MVIERYKDALEEEQDIFIVQLHMSSKQFFTHFWPSTQLLIKNKDFVSDYGFWEDSITNHELREWLLTEPEAVTIYHRVDIIDPILIKAKYTTEFSFQNRIDVMRFKLAWL